MLTSKATTARELAGRGGLGGGGRGGDAVVRGDNITSAGGEGGEANQPDGRGGRGGKSGYFTLGLPDYQLPDGRWISEFGGGGNGGHSPQYAARLMAIEEVLGHTITMHAASAGIRDDETSDAVLSQLNERLGRDQRTWRFGLRLDVSSFTSFEIGFGEACAIDRFCCGSGN